MAALKRRGTSAAGGWSERQVWMACLAMRLANALMVRTYFNPDEHWQALEVAHRIVFGYGHLTWEWKEGLRSYLHPLIFALVYKVMAIVKLDTPWLMVRAPRLFQALLAAAGDVYLWKLARQTFGEQAAKWTIFCQLTNWFTFFCMVRTLSSSLETVLTTIALFYWSAPTARRTSRPLTNRQLALSTAWFSCAIRPTSAVIWLYVGAYHLHKCNDKTKYLFAEVLPIGSLILGATFIIDWWMYGKWTFVPLNFLLFNFVSAGGDFYGSHPWHWYFTQGFPTMAFTQLPFTLLGIWWSKQWFLAGLIGWIMFMYSLLGHKEFRFVLPALPLAMLFAGYSLASMESRKKVAPKRRSWSFNFSVIILGIVLTNIPVALYTSLVHQRGSEAVMEYLAEEAAEGRVRSILFLTQCHGTPYYSSLHKNLPMKFLDCSPSGEKDYKDEAARFMEDPLGALALMYGESNATLPSHVVLFDSLESQIQPFLDTQSYKLVKRIFHAHFPVDRELQAYLLVYTKQH